MNTAFTVSSADCRGNAAIVNYPHRHSVTCAEDFREVVKHDYVFGIYENNYRDGEHFQSSNALGVDCDNDHSEDPSAWFTPEDIHKKLPGVPMLIHYSRHNNLPKGEKSARPRFHVAFLIDVCKNADEYKALKQRLQAYLPIFDIKALDAARCFFGTENPEVGFYDGHRTLNDYFFELDQRDEEIERFLDGRVPDRNTIPEGRRNATLSHFAGRILKRLGDTEYAHEQFLRRAESCDPPLDDEELDHIWRSAQKFYAKISSEEGYIQPDQFFSGLRPFNYTDVDEARVFADAYRDCLRHSTATEYIVYDGTVWVESEARAHGKLHELTDRQLAEHEEEYAQAKAELIEAEEALDRVKVALADKDDKTSKGKKTFAERTVKNAERKYKFEDAYHQFLLKCRNSGRISGILEEAKTLLEIDVADLDSDPFLLNTPGGEVNLRTGELLPHDPEHYHTHITAVAPSAEGMREWQDFLTLITCGDKELEDYLQITSGEELVGRIYNENMRIKVGQGSNGKSTYTNTKLRVIGSYGGQISAETLTTGNKNGKNWEIAELRGKRLVVASELEEGMRLNTSFVKKICSTDPILGEKKHKDPFTFLPSHTVVLYTNHLPKVGSIDKGTWRRLTVIPFNATIQGSSDIKNYTDFLFEHCGGAVLAWMIEGAKRFIDARFHIMTPECVRKAIENYHTESDWVTAFLEECCATDPTYSVKAGELYQVYRSYCDSIGEFKRNPQEFKAAIVSFGFRQKKTKVGAFYYGLRVKGDDLSDDEDDFLQ